MKNKFDRILLNRGAEMDNGTQRQGEREIFSMQRHNKDTQEKTSDN